MKTFESVAELEKLVGEELGASDWLEITQERIDDFAKATGDFQWIHTDPERAKKESPFGKTIAHGFLSLSILPIFFEQMIQVRQVKMMINYGLNQVRFIQPVTVGSFLRLKAAIKKYEVTNKGVKVIVDCQIEIKGNPKPACLAESILLFL